MERVSGSKCVWKFRNSMICTPITHKFTYARNSDGPAHHRLPPCLSRLHLYRTQVMSTGETLTDPVSSPILAVISSCIPLSLLESSHWDVQRKSQSVHTRTTPRERETVEQL
jgi:hypothetical protein